MKTYERVFDWLARRFWALSVLCEDIAVRLERTKGLVRNAHAARLAYKLNVMSADRFRKTHLEENKSA